MMEIEDYKQAIFSLKSDLQDSEEELSELRRSLIIRHQTDLEFLEEIIDHLNFYQEKRDPTRFELAKDMVNDWIAELKKKTK